MIFFDKKRCCPEKANTVIDLGEHHRISIYHQNARQYQNYSSCPEKQPQYHYSQLQVLILVHYKIAKYYFQNTHISKKKKPQNVWILLAMLCLGIYYRNAQ